MSNKIGVEEGLEMLSEQVAQLSHVVAGIIQEMKTLTGLSLADMKEREKLLPKHCDDCDLTTFVPNIEGVETDDCCNQCLKSFDEEQTTLESFEEE